MKPPTPSIPSGNAAGETIGNALDASASKALRSQLRKGRRALSAREQRLHAERLARVLGREAAFLRARRVALYSPADGEIDPFPLLRRGAQGLRRPYLPVLRPGRAPGLTFAPFRLGDRLSRNRLGIPEPGPRRGRIHPRHLDLILLPLVGFDLAGHRIGMGGGFYDRSLAFLNRRTRWRRPRLIGLAHECQRLPSIAPQPWDVPLDGVATERRLYWGRVR